MGDLPAGATPQSLNTTTEGFSHDERQNPSSRSTVGNNPFHSQLSSVAQSHGRPDIRSAALASTPHYLTPDGHDSTALNMASLSGALPELHSIDHGPGNLYPPQRPPSGASTSALIYQLQQNMQAPSHASGALPTHSPYGHYQQNFQPTVGSQPAYTGPFHPTQQRMHPTNPLPTSYQNFSQPSQYMFYPAPYGPQGQALQGFPALAAQTQAMYGRRASLTNVQPQMMAQGPDMTQFDGMYASDGRVMGGVVPADLLPMPVLTGSYGASNSIRSEPATSITRGPPRKPKQSGHALWVGNLPPGTTVTALKDHFSRDATKDIESLFLISKSNCAFVNYRTEASCTAAMHRFHDSRFNGVRLVCRLRRSSAPASGVPTGPSAMTGNQHVSHSPPKSPQQPDGGDSQVDGISSPNQDIPDRGKHTSTTKDKYFIVKSLTLQDLESSVRNGIWATQSHNEEALNKAFETSENVYLIFSANKSGEYFGYARMASPISNEPTSLIGPEVKPEVVNTPDIPKSIPTPATEWAPKGRIIDDSARGTIFWEADLTESEGEEVDGEVDGKKEEPHTDDVSAVPQAWGKPFKVEWVSTNRLPFYRTRGLRNPWNANREVKIARDGTELETSVGERLIQMFHRLGPSGPAMPMAGPMMQPPPFGVPQMRPY